MGRSYRPHWRRAYKPDGKDDKKLEKHCHLRPRKAHAPAPNVRGVEAYPPPGLLALQAFPLPRVPQIEEPWRNWEEYQFEVPPRRLWLGNQQSAGHHRPANRPWETIRRPIKVWFYWGGTLRVRRPKTPTRSRSRRSSQNPRRTQAQNRRRNRKKGLGRQSTERERVEWAWIVKEESWRAQKVIHG